MFICFFLFLSCERKHGENALVLPCMCAALTKHKRKKKHTYTFECILTSTKLNAIHMHDAHELSAISSEFEAKKNCHTKDAIL